MHKFGVVSNEQNFYSCRQQKPIVWNNLNHNNRDCGRHAFYFECTLQKVVNKIATMKDKQKLFTFVKFRSTKYSDLASFFFAC